MDVPELVDLAEDSAWAISASEDSSTSTQAAGVTDDIQRPADDGELASSSGTDALWKWGLLALLAISVGGGLWARGRGRAPEAIPTR